MGTISRKRALGAVVLGVLLGAAVLGVLAFLAGYRPAQRAAADFPHAGLDLSISVGAQCDSTAGPTTCNLGLGETLTLSMNVNTLPADLAYDGYDARVVYSGVTYVSGSEVQQGADVWPECGFPAFDTTTVPGEISTVCALGIGAVSSTYAGALWHVDMQCPNTDTLGVLTMPHGQGVTALVDSSLQAHGETGSESLTILCGTPPTPTPTSGTPQPTPTPGGETATPTFTRTATPTITPTPTFTVTPTRTRRPHETLLGDVDGDLAVDARDALWVLWFDARIVVDVPIPEAADMNEDDVVDATDALFILWVDGGLFELL